MLISTFPDTTRAWSICPCSRPFLLGKWPWAPILEIHHFGGVDSVVSSAMRMVSWELPWCVFFFRCCPQRSDRKQTKTSIQTWSLFLFFEIAKKETAGVIGCVKPLRSLPEATTVCVTGQFPPKLHGFPIAFPSKQPPAVKFGRGKVSQKLARPCKPKRVQGTMLCLACKLLWLSS